MLALTALNELYRTIRKQENAHPEAALFVASDFNAGEMKSVLSNFYQHITCGTTAKEIYSRSPLLYTQKRKESSHSPSIWQI